MIKIITHSIILVGTLAFVACSQASDAVDTTRTDVIKVAQNTTTTPQSAPSGQRPSPPPTLPTDLSILSAGTYKSDDTHEYIAFDYLHQGYSNPILRWDDIDATINLIPNDLESSSLDVIIHTSSISSGVPIWDERLQNDKYFDAVNFPTMRFKSTKLKMISNTKGTVTGDLTIKDISVPVTLDVTLNKVGKHFRKGNDWFGISGTTSLNRSDFGLSNAIPITSDNVNIRVEVEFGKVD